MKQPLIVGLTGGIASGKTACSHWFAKQGIPIVDADVVARKVVSIGEPALLALQNLFGDDIIQSDGNLHRARLRQIVFSSIKAKAQVETILHPAIAEASQNALSALSDEPIIMRVVPLLFEKSIHDQCDVVVSVDIPEELQINRGAERDRVTQKDIANIIQSQVPRYIRLARSHYIIDNSLSLLETYRQCDVILHYLRRFLFAVP